MTIEKTKNTIENDEDVLTNRYIKRAFIHGFIALFPTLGVADQIGKLIKANNTTELRTVIANIALLALIAGYPAYHSAINLIALKQILKPVKH